MALDMSIKIGDIKGELVAPKDEIKVLAWSWGMTQSGTTQLGPGGGTGKVSVQDLSFTKYVDKASPNLMKYCCTGKHFDDATLTVCKSGDTTPLAYLKITMTRVLISSVSTGGSGGEDLITENVSLNFNKFKVEYTPQTAKGTADTTIPAGYDVAGKEAS